VNKINQASSFEFKFDLSYWYSDVYHVETMIRQYSLPVINAPSYTSLQPYQIWPPLIMKHSGRKSIKRKSRKPTKSVCSACNNPGHSVKTCSAKDSAKIIDNNKLGKAIQKYCRIPSELLNSLKPKFTVVSIDNLRDSIVVQESFDEPFDEKSDDSDDETDDDDDEVVEDTKDGVNDEVSCDVLDKSSTYAAVVQPSSSTIFQQHMVQSSTECSEKNLGENVHDVDNFFLGSSIDDKILLDLDNVCDTLLMNDDSNNVLRQDFCSIHQIIHCSCSIIYNYKSNDICSDKSPEVPLHHQPRLVPQNEDHNGYINTDVIGKNHAATSSISSPITNFEIAGGCADKGNILVTTNGELYYCICQKQYDNFSDEMLGCDNEDNCLHPSANGWFHYRCVDMSKETFQKISNNSNSSPWYCSACANGESQLAVVVGNNRKQKKRKNIDEMQSHSTKIFVRNN